MDLGLESLIAPELAAFVDEAREFRLEWQARVDAEGWDLRTPEGLAGMRASLAERPATSGPPIVDFVAEAEGRSVPVRIVVPEGEARGVFLDIHGGGFYMGWAARNDARNRRLADAAGIAVVSVDYRLAPEHPWPAAPDDCETAALWLLAEAESRFGATKLAIGGASAGANLAMTTLFRLRERGLLGRFVGAAQLYGVWDLSGITPGGKAIAHEYLIDAYVGHVEDRTNPDISPIFGDLADLPPTLIVVGTHDRLLEDNLTMAARLAAAGREVDVRVYPESPHPFTSFPTGMAEAAVSGIESWLADRFSDSV